jgi:hypothetical protein
VDYGRDFALSLDHTLPSNLVPGTAILPSLSPSDILPNPLVCIIVLESPNSVSLERQPPLC